MSAVGALGSRLLASLSFYTRVAFARAGTGNVVVAAITTAAVIYSWRRLQRTAIPDRRQGNAERTRSGASRRQRRGKTLVGVQKVTIGIDVVSFPGTFLECGANADVDSPDADTINSPAGDANGEIEPLCADGDRSGPVADIDGVPVRESFKLKPDCVKNLQQFASLFELYVIARIDSDENEEKLRKVLEEAKLFECGLDPRKVVFCETETGRVSIVRQIEPDLHVDETASVVSELQRFVKFVAFISPQAKATPGLSASNVLKYSSLGRFFDTSAPKS